MASGGKMKVKETKWFWIYWIIGALLLTLGIFLLPVWENVNVFWSTWSRGSINIILFVLTLLYVIYLIMRVDRSAVRSKLVINVAEIVAMFVVALLCLLQQFDVMRGIGPAFVISFALWLRGIYFVLESHMFGTSKRGGTLAWIAIGLLCVTFGAAGMVREVTTTPVFLWVISIALILLAVGVVFFGIFSIPKKAKKPTQPTTPPAP